MTPCYLSLLFWTKVIKRELRKAWDIKSCWSFWKHKLNRLQNFYLWWKTSKAFEAKTFRLRFGVINFFIDFVVFILIKAGSFVHQCVQMLNLKRQVLTFHIILNKKIQHSWVRQTFLLTTWKKQYVTFLPWT